MTDFVIQVEGDGNPTMSDYIPEPDRPVHPFSDLSDTGLLWLINRVVFHPRGFALALHLDRQVDGEPAPGWQLLGDGAEVWAFTGGHEDERFAAVQEFLGRHTAPRGER